MPKASTNLEATNNRFNPYITKSINKSLLTPCRRVGLSRKRKTPNSGDRNSDIMNSSLQDSTQLNTETTPVTSKSISSENFNENVKSRDKVDVKKKSISKCLIAAVKTENDQKSTELNTQSDDELMPLKELKKKAEEKMNNKRTSILKEPKKKLGESNTNTNSVTSKNKPTENPSENVKLGINKGIIKKKSINYIDSDSDDDLMPLQQIKKKVEEKMTKKSSSIAKEPEKELGQINSKKKSNQKLMDYISDSDDDLMPLKGIQKKEVEKANKKSNLILEELEKEQKPLQTKNKSRENRNTILKEINNELEETLHKSKEKKSQSPVVKEIDKVKIDITKQTVPEVVSQKPENINKQEVTLDGGPIFEALLMDHNYTKPEKKSSKMKRSLSMKKSSEDNKILSRNNSLTLKECSVLLSKINSETSLKENLPSIEALEQQLQEKRKLVEDLTQAEIYKKLHNVNKLRELTKTWKIGCISALNDLLPHLKSQGDIDMATLLNNLQVPEKLIKLTDKGDLI